MQKKYGKLSGFSFKVINFVSMIIFGIFSVLLLISIFLLADRYHNVNNSTLEYTKWKNKATELNEASDYLTDNVRLFVIEQEKSYLDNYFEETKNIRRRDNAIEVLKDKLEGTYAFNLLNSAMTKSKDLENSEYHAMRLIVEINEYNLDLFPDEVKNYVLKDEELALSKSEMNSKAIDLVFGLEYQNAKNYISENVSKCVDELDDMTEGKINDSQNSLKKIMVVQQVIIMLLIVFFILFFINSHFNIVIPLTKGIQSLLDDDLLEIKGFKEYKYFALKYNDIRMKETDHNAKLEYEAEHDKLTGLYNRTGYDSYCSNLDVENMVYILTDVDFFKQINDKYGHDVGDKVLKLVSDKLREYFHNDFVCRIGGDEFAVIIEKYNSELYDNIKKKIDKLNDELKNLSNLPHTSMSFGVALGTSRDNISSLSVKADKALYITKSNGRCGVSFFEY